jgi:hypothetical protein
MHPGTTKFVSLSAGRIIHGIQCYGAFCNRLLSRYRTTGTKALPPKAKGEDARDYYLDRPKKARRKMYASTQQHINTIQLEKLA